MCTERTSHKQNLNTTQTCAVLGSRWAPSTAQVLTTCFRVPCTGLYVRLCRRVENFLWPRGIPTEWFRGILPYIQPGLQQGGRHWPCSRAINNSQEKVLEKQESPFLKRISVEPCLDPWTGWRGWRWVGRGIGWSGSRSRRWWSSTRSRRTRCSTGRCWSETPIPLWQPGKERREKGKVLLPSVSEVRLNHSLVQWQPVERWKMEI